MHFCWVDGVDGREVGLGVASEFSVKKEYDASVNKVDTLERPERV